jgi:hypothetical protein
MVDGGFKVFFRLGIRPETRTNHAQEITDPRTTWAEKQTERCKVSVDRIWHVPAGDRDMQSANWRKYPSGDKSITITPHRVFLAHGGNSLTNELFLFDDKEDAKWFYKEGFRGMLFHDGNETVEAPPDHMYLDIDDKTVAQW